MTDVRILSEALGGSALSRLLQEGGDRTPWLTPAPTTPEGWAQRAEQRRAEGGWQERWTTLDPAIAATGRAADRLERVRREGGVVVTTGQQPGLFGGPVYTWSKAVGAIALADALEAATGIPTAPLFWAATDDADFTEASSTVVARTGGAIRLRATEVPPPGTPLSLAPLGDLSAPLAELRRACGSTMDPWPLQATLDAYGEPSRTAGDAFVRLLRVLLSPLGMPVLDASHPAMLDVSRATLQSARQAAPAIERALAARAAELRAAGYEPQVEDVPGLSLVFAREGGVKRRLTVDEARASDDGWYTPNVLLRPIVEQAIVPTVAYLAGPGELAYFAQVSAVSAALGHAAPVAVPRWSCTMLEPHIRTLLARHNASPSDLAAPDLLEGRLARGTMSPTTATALAALRASIGSLPRALESESRGLGLERAVEGAMGSLQHRMDRLERRLVAGIKRREAGLMQEVGTLRGALYPYGVRQERMLNPISLLARHGSELLNEMRAAAGSHADTLVGATRNAISSRVHA